MSDEIMTRSYDVKNETILCAFAWHDLKRRWDIRFEYAPGFLLHIGVNLHAPAARIIVLCLGIWFGKIPPRPQVSETIEIPRKLSGGEDKAVAV